jgi:Fe-Mn family superoxide dismutase
MKKRQFIQIAGTTIAGTIMAPYLSCTSRKEEKSGETVTSEFILPDLPYDYTALEPNIDARTMEIHHTRHHAGYVSKLNAALADSNFAGRSMDEIMAGVGENDTALRNNGGGHYNHSLFWAIMGPLGGGRPDGEIAGAIETVFGSYDQFKEDFSTEAATVFGSGWAWLCLNKDKKLFITSTPNQDNPLMVKLVEVTGTPILGIDVWEHAYYLKYQNRRGEYISNFFNIINWEEVNRRYLENQ